MADDSTTSAARNLVICLDCTTNEPEQGFTNVARVFDICTKDAQQLVYYDPGVGTMGSRAAVTQIGRAATRVAGMAAGYGIREILEATHGGRSLPTSPTSRRPAMPWPLMSGGVPLPNTVLPVKD